MSSIIEKPKNFHLIEDPIEDPIEAQELLMEQLEIPIAIAIQLAEIAEETMRLIAEQKLIEAEIAEEKDTEAFIQASRYTLVKIFGIVVIFGVPILLYNKSIPVIDSNIATIPNCITTEQGSIKSSWVESHDSEVIVTENKLSTWEELTTYRQSHDFTLFTSCNL